jgi:hypothetical protein
MLFFALSSATSTRLTSAQEKKIVELRQSKLGEIMLTLAELHLMSGGPVEDLNEALEALIEDITVKIEDNDAAYNERSIQNQIEVTRLEGLISDTEVQISNANNILENILYPALEELQSTLASQNQSVEENNAYVAAITAQREADHEVYESNVAEQNDALSAINECLEILGQLSSGNISLIQTKKFKTSLNKVVVSLKKSTNNSMVKALISLANQEFANTGVILKIIDAFTGVKQGVLDALDLLHADEKAAVEHFEAEVTEREQDNKRLAREINITLGEIDGTENRIFEKEAYLADRQSTLAAFNAELDAEHEAFEEATAFYEDVRSELVREQAVANDAYGIIQNAGFGSNLSQNVGF